jgi:multidrug efflux pump subunit AcrA (membrane-fusion protein)
LWSAQINRDATCGGSDAGGRPKDPNSSTCRAAEASVGNAVEAERRAYQAYLDAQKGPTADKVASASASVLNAQTQVKSAENAVKTAENGVTTAQNNANSAYGSVQSAQINLENAKIKLDTLLNPNNSENALAAKARLDQAYASWEAAINNISKATIYAPHDGVVTTLSFETGDFLGSGSKALEVTAFERPLFEVDVDEADVANIRIGQEARVLLQSYSQAPISATVDYIAPAASVQGNITTVKVRLALGQVGFGGGRTATAGGAAGQQGQGGGQAGAAVRNPAIATAIAQGTPAASVLPQGGQGQPGGGQGRGPAGGGGPGAGGAFTRTAQIPNIIIGMSGTADIIASRIDNALQVPNRALIANRQTRGFGVWRQKADGTVELVTVTTGTRGANSTQITGGIEAGDTILIPAATATGAGGQQGGFGGGNVVKAPLP